MSAHSIFPQVTHFLKAIYAVFFLSLPQQKAVKSKKGIHFPLPPPPPLSCSLLEMPSKVAVLSPSPSPTYTVCTQQQLWGRREGAVTASTELFFSPPPPFKKVSPGWRKEGEEQWSREKETLSWKLWIHLSLHFHAGVKVYKCIFLRTAKHMSYCFSWDRCRYIVKCLP